jgi:myosin heavy chain 6/7
MPKVEKQVGDDPDPSEWLFISLEQKRIDQSKPYDAKKACWVPDEKQGYVLGEIKSTKGDLVSVGIPGGEVNYSTHDVIIIIHDYSVRLSHCSQKKIKLNFISILHENHN